MLKNKRVLVNGCSFSRGQGSWPYHLLVQSMVNLAQCGAGNTYIHCSTLSELAKRTYDMVLIMWSGFDRVDIQVDNIALFDHIQYTSLNQSKLNDWPEKVIEPVNDQDYVEKNWVFAAQYNEEPLVRLKFCETNYKYQGYKEKLTQSLIHMISLQNTLKQLNIPYVYSYYIDYEKELSSHELYKFLDLSNVCNAQNLGSIAKSQGWLDNTRHPTAPAHAVWASVLTEFIENKNAKKA